VHGRLPYELIKPDIQLRNLLRSIKQRKIVCSFSNINSINFILLFFLVYVSNSGNVSVFCLDFYKFRQDSRAEGVGSIRDKRLFRTNHMFRDFEPESTKFNPTRRIPCAPQTFFGCFQNCDPRCQRGSSSYSKSIN
jgi:hypothetical protein